MGNSAYKLLIKALFFSVFLIFISLSPGEDSFTIVFLEQSYIRFLVYGISFLFLILFLIHNGKNGKLDPLKTDEGDHLKFLLQKSVKLFIGNGV